MWGAIKKAINSDLTKPLDKLMKELQVEIKTKLDNISSNTVKIETIFGRLVNNNNPSNVFFEITGKSGTLKMLSQKNRSDKDLQDFNLYIDGKTIYPIYTFGVVQNNTGHTENQTYVYNLNLDFNNSVKISVPYGRSIDYLIQTRK